MAFFRVLRVFRGLKRFANVAQIEEEQRLVNANKELIRLFEAKIKATINRVWGEAE